MKLVIISEGLVTVQPYDLDGDVDGVGEQCEYIAKESGICISSNKQLTLVAYAGDEPMGAVWSAFEPDHEATEYHGQDVYRYDFDVAVKPTARAVGLTSTRVGPKLIDAAMDQYRELKADYPAAYIRVWVVNPKLARFLEDNYSFEIDGSGGWSLDNPHMSFYG